MICTRVIVAGLIGVMTICLTDGAKINQGTGANKVLQNSNTESAGGGQTEPRNSKVNSPTWKPVIGRTDNSSTVPATASTNTPPEQSGCKVCQGKNEGLVRYPTALAPDSGSVSVTTKCADNAQLRSGYSLNVRCNSDGTWSGTIPQCQCNNGYRAVTTGERYTCGAINPGSSPAFFKGSDEDEGDDFSSSAAIAMISVSLVCLLLILCLTIAMFILSLHLMKKLRTKDSSLVASTINKQV